MTVRTDGECGPVMHTPGENEFPDPTLIDTSLGRPAAEPGPPAPGTGCPEEPPKPRRRRRKGRIIAVVAGSLVLAIVLLLVSLWLYADNSLHHVDAIDNYAGRPAGGAGTNWLIVGSDSRQGLSAAEANRLHTGSAQDVSGSRTDTIIDRKSVV